MYKIDIIRSTACLTLKDENDNLIDYHFMNKYQFENLMTQDELKQEIINFAERNGLTVLKDEIH